MGGGYPAGGGRWDGALQLAHRELEGGCSSSAEASARLLARRIRVNWDNPFTPEHRDYKRHST